MSRTWVNQDPKQVQKVGEDQASWYAYWLDPAGRRRCKSCGSGKRGKYLAEKYAERIKAQLLTGTYEDHRSKTWEQFRREHDEKIVQGMPPATAQLMNISLDAFERIIQPERMKAITSVTLADFVAKRRQEPGLRGKPLSEATVNRDLRHVRAALVKAVDWKYLTTLPTFDFLREKVRLPTFVSPEDFARLYGACDAAELPEGLPYPAGEWWRGLLVFALMTGWRIGSILALRREDVDLEGGTVKSHADENKGKRDQLVPLHPIVVDHLRRLPSFSPLVFPWSAGRRFLWETFHAIQVAAGVKPTGKARYGFNDLRRAFATLNADRLTPDMLQRLMQHKDYQTTRRYIELAQQMTPTLQNLYVPPLPPRSGTAN